MSANVGAANITFGKGLTGKLHYEKFIYNFANDGGAAANTVDIGTISGNILVVNACLQVFTAFTSGGSATVACGVEDQDIDCFLAATAVATLVDNYAVKQAAGQAIWLPSGDTVRVTIATADLTAGAFALHLFYVNAD